MSKIRALYPNGYKRFLLPRWSRNNNSMLFSTSLSSPPQSPPPLCCSCTNNVVDYNKNQDSGTKIHNARLNHDLLSKVGHCSLSSSSLLFHRRYSSSTVTTASITVSDDNANSSTNTRTSLMSKDEYDPMTISNNIHKAAQWNQGDTGPNAKWDPEFCSQSVHAYIRHLHYIHDYIQQQNTNNHNHNSDDKINNTPLPPHSRDLLSPHTTERALKAMLKLKIPTYQLSKTIRQTEKLIGLIGYTQLTNSLSLRLLEANGKAGNIGRTIALLNLRKQRQYHTKDIECIYAIQSIHSASLYLRQNRNVFLKEKLQPDIDNPTRWLDAILVNMSQRGVKLDTKTANRMLDCYACTGRSGKATHFFYKVIQKEIINVNVDDENVDGIDNDDEEEEGDDEIVGLLNNEKNNDNEEKEIINQQNDNNEDSQQEKEIKARKTKIRMKFNTQSPPFYKIPSEVKLQNEMIKRPRREGLVSKLEWEKVRHEGIIICIIILWFVQ